MSRHARRSLTSQSRRLRRRSNRMKGYSTSLPARRCCRCLCSSALRQTCSIIRCTLRDNERQKGDVAIAGY